MKKSTFLIVGRHAVTEALKNPNRKVHRLFITEDALKKLNRENQNTNLIKKVHVFYKSKKEIDNLCGKEDISHQNIVAEIENLISKFFSSSSTSINPLNESHDSIVSGPDSSVISEIGMEKTFAEINPRRKGINIIPKNPKSQ